VINNGDPGVTVVSDPASSGRGNVFRVFFPEGGFGTDVGGTNWQTRIAPRDEYYFAFDLFVPAGFNWPLSSKLPGLFGGNLNVAVGNKAVLNGVDAWSAFQGIMSDRLPGETSGFYNIGDGALGATTFTYDGAQIFRRYNPALTDSWDATPEGAARLIPGTWSRLEQHVKLNTATGTTGVGVKANGVYEIWLDGVKVYEAFNWTYRRNKSLQIDGIFFISYYGGYGDEWGAREDQYWYFDNYVVSTIPITHQ